MTNISNRSDVFSSLFHWAHRQGENFTTDAFVFLVQELLDRDPEPARRFLSWLCFDEAETGVFLKCIPSIATQRRSEDGIPDIWILVSDVIVLVEVKKGSDLHQGQLGQYRRLLERRPERRKQLVLLTAYSTSFLDNEIPDRWIRWSDVQRWFEQNTFEDAVSSWLVAQFLGFLRRQVMAIEKVEWQFIDGTKALYNLTIMLGKALENAGIPVARGQASWDSRGHYTKDTQFWTGVVLTEPEIMRFQFYSAKPDLEKIKEHGWECVGSRCETTLNLTAEGVHFFARSKDSQLDCLTEFLRNAHLTATQCIVKS